MGNRINKTVAKGLETLKARKGLQGEPSAAVRFWKGGMRRDFLALRSVSREKPRESRKLSKYGLRRKGKPISMIILFK